MYITVHLECVGSIKARKTAKRLGLTPEHFVDHVLTPIWRMAAMSSDGRGEIAKLDDEVIEDVTRGAVSSGSLAILIEFNWIESRNGSLWIHDWEHHQNFFAERARKRDVARRSRKSQEVAGSSSYMPLHSDDSGDVAGSSVLEEKRITESKENTKPSKSHFGENPPIQETAQDSITTRSEDCNGSRHHAATESTPRAKSTRKATFADEWCKSLSVMCEKPPPIAAICKLINSWARTYTQAVTAQVFSCFQAEGKTYGDWGKFVGAVVATLKRQFAAGAIEARAGAAEVGAASGGKFGRVVGENVRSDKHRNKFAKREADWDARCAAARIEKESGSSDGLPSVRIGEVPKPATVSGENGGS